MDRRQPNRSVTRRACAVLISLVAATAPHVAGADPGEHAAPATADDGHAIYVQRCAPCHGATGKGDGAEASSFAPPPRDLTGGSLDGLDDERIVARLRDGLPIALGPAPRALQQRLGHLEEVTGHLQKLPDIDWRTVDRGAALYERSCAVCHGPFGQPLDPSVLPRGVLRPPRDLRDPTFQAGITDDALVAAMQHGKSAMPAILATREPGPARDLVAFVRLLSPGFETYSYYCAPCHGDDGRGGGVLAQGKNAPPVAFDRAWRARQDPEQLRSHVSHMLTLHGPAMPHFRGTLSNAQLRAVVGYLASAFRSPAATVTPPAAGAR
jgi:mono/diheme cytochrome c family protein